MARLPDGTPTPFEVDRLRQGELFADMERFSREFRARNADTLAPYDEAWDSDPLNAWSRQWEYPYVFAALQAEFEGREEPVTVLDAGSGVTFFPYYAMDRLPGLRMDACDLDPAWGPLYAQINAREPRQVAFTTEDLRQLSAPDAHYDALTCISVLEHVPNPEKAAREFRRVLKPGGVLVLTLDVKLRGDYEIPLPQAVELMETLAKELEPQGPYVQAMRDLERMRHPLTAGWRHAEKVTPKAAMPQLKLKVKRQFFPKLFEDLTFFCATFRRKE